MAKTYIICVDNEGVSTSIDVSILSGCVPRDYTDGSGCYVRAVEKILKFTTSVASDEPFTIYYKTTVEYYLNGVSEGSGVINGTVEMPAGATSIQRQVLCEKTIRCGDTHSGGILTIYLEEYGDYTLRDQYSIPECVVVDPATCDIEITSITTNDVTLRGDSDGSITATFTGYTGTTSCYINGALDGTTTGGNYTFSGLEAGYYEIRISVAEFCYDQEHSIQILDGEFRTGDFRVNEPYNISAANNPIILNLKTARTSDTPKASKGYFSVFPDILDGDKITFNFTYPQEYTATFYAKNFPDRDNYFLATQLNDSQGNAAGTNTKNEILYSLLEVLEKDTVISRLYWLSTGNARVYLEAKENNTLLDIDNVVTIDAGTRITTRTLETGAAAYDGQLSQNYSLYADISVNTNVQYGEDDTNETYHKVAQLEFPFNSINNQHYFDLSDILKNFVSTPKIDFTLTGHTTIASMLCGYKISYGEKYPLIQNSSTKKSRYKGETSTKYVLNSALDWHEKNTLEEYFGDVLHNVKTNFTATFTFDYPTTTNTYIDVDDYLIDTGSTKTTDIKFKIYDGLNDNTYDWQSSSQFTVAGSDFHGSSQGQIYISGVTSGISFVYVRNYSSTARHGNGNFSLNYSPTVIHNVKFLTDSPNPKIVQRDSSEFLYILIEKDYGKTLKVKGDLYFSNGKSLTGETFYTVSTGGTNWGGVFMFAAGYNELGLADYETYSGGTRKIRKVDFALYQSDDANGDYLLSEQRSYRFKIDEQARRYGVAFLSKLGTYSIFDFAGEIVNDITYTSEEYEIPREITIYGSSPKGFQSKTVYNTKVVKTIQANTGWIDEETFDWLMELINSNRCYNYTETDQSFLIASNPVYKKSSNDDLYKIDVTFTETIFQNNISV
jgi:hypothetical protein